MANFQNATRIEDSIRAPTLFFRQNDYYPIFAPCFASSFQVLTTTVLEEQKFQNLVSQLVSKSKLSKEKIDDLIREKKSKVGGGYLTDKGALFLVASQLGVDVEYANESLCSISEITSESNALTLIARVLSIGFRVFDRRDNSRKGVLLRLAIYDNTGSLYLNLWDHTAVSFLKGQEIKPGDVIKITDGYAKRALDGSVILNLGSGGKIESNLDDKSAESGIRLLGENTLAPSSVPEEGKMLTVKGNVEGDVKKSNFVRSDGSASNYLAFSVRDEHGGKVRSVIWNNLNPVFESLRNDENITLLNVRSKASRFQDVNTVELHGDDATCILERWSETRIWMIEQVEMLESFKEKSSQKADGTGAFEKTSVPFVARIVSIRRREEEDRSHVLLLDSQSRKINVTILGKAAESGLEFRVDDIVVCKPKTFDSATLKVTVEPNSLVKSNSKRADIPKSDSLFARVENLETGQIVFLEMMCMSEAITREIQTREGLIRRSEITVGDHTGEIKLYGWRDMAKSLDDFSVGDRMILRGAEVLEHAGRKFLNLKSYSSMSRVA